MALPLRAAYSARMNNPYAAPTADPASPAGVDGLRVVATTFGFSKGFLSTQLYQGKVYACGDYLAMCADKNLSSQNQAAIFGLIGMLAYYLFRKKKEDPEVDRMPAEVVDQLAQDKIKPIKVILLRRQEVDRIESGFFGGTRVFTAKDKLLLSGGIGGRKSMLAQLHALGYPCLRP